jgi:hypothetical protein
MQGLPLPALTFLGGGAPPLVLPHRTAPACGAGVYPAAVTARAGLPWCAPSPPLAPTTLAAQADLPWARPARLGPCVAPSSLPPLPLPLPWLRGRRREEEEDDIFVIYSLFRFNPYAGI